MPYSGSGVDRSINMTLERTEYGGTVCKVDKQTMKRGVVYEAMVKSKEGQYSEIKVAEDSKLLKYKTGKQE